MNKSSIFNKYIEKCKQCNGIGLVKCNMILCKNCNGAKCYLCKGRGYVQSNYKECEKCWGCGKILNSNNIELIKLYRIYKLS